MTAAPRGKEGGVSGSYLLNSEDFQLDSYLVFEDRSALAGVAQWLE